LCFVSGVAGERCAADFLGDCGCFIGLDVEDGYLDALFGEAD
jgi:hypothetical protein